MKNYLKGQSKHNFSAHALTTGEQKAVAFITIHNPKTIRAMLIAKIFRIKIFRNSRTIFFKIERYSHVILISSRRHHR